jgi:U3 small nucleolar RNA-associated protein 24
VKKIIGISEQRNQAVTTPPQSHTMGVQKKTRKFATVKRVISQRDDRLKKNQPTPLDKQKKQSGKDELVRSM